MNRRSLARQSGFTLVEIAVVLVIIGLLLGAILKGQELVENSRVKNAVNDFNKDKLSPYTAKLEEIKKKVIAGEIKVPDSDTKVREWAMATFK